MGISTDGQICFGIKFEEEFEFPWDASEYDGDINYWWRMANGGPPNPYDKEDELKSGMTPEEVDKEWEYCYVWQKQNPCPIELVDYCGSNCPMYILTTSFISCSRGFPKSFEPQELVSSKKELIDFCEKWGIEIVDEPRWWLSSCMY